MALTRTDVHRPSAINPADYEFVGLEHRELDLGLGAVAAVLAERDRIRAHMSRTGGDYSQHEHGGNCHVCGAHCVYTALFYHPPTNSYVRTGMDCATKMGMGDARRFRVFTDAVRAAQKHRAGRRKAEGVLGREGLADAWLLYRLLAEHARPEECPVDPTEQGQLSYTRLAVAADWYEEQGRHPTADLLRGVRGTNAGHNFEETTVVDVVGKLVKYGSLSGKQLGFLRTLMGRIAGRPTAEARREAEKAAAADVPSGRHTFRCKVLKTEWRDNDYGGSLKILVKANGAGYTLWGNAPAAVQLVEVEGPAGPGDGPDPAVKIQRGLGRGDRLELTATLTRSDKDPKFGFFARPIARFIGAAE